MRLELLGQQVPQVLELLEPQVQQVLEVERLELLGPQAQLEMMVQLEPLALLVLPELMELTE